MFDRFVRGFNEDGDAVMIRTDRVVSVRTTQYCDDPYPLTVIVDWRGTQEVVDPAQEPVCEIKTSPGLMIPVEAKLALDWLESEVERVRQDVADRLRDAEEHGR